MTQAAYADDDAQLLAACDVHRGLSSGPGGQHANRTHSAIRLLHRATGLSAQCQDHRQQQRNQQEALKRLRLRIALHQRGHSQPAWLEPFRQAQRLHVSASNARYPLLVAVLLDALQEHQGHLAQAAQSLGCSSSQVVKALAQDKEVLQAAQALLERFGAPALKMR